MNYASRLIVQRELNLLLEDEMDTLISEMQERHTNTYFKNIGPYGLSIECSNGKYILGLNFWDRNSKHYILWAYTITGNKTMREMIESTGWAWAA